MSPHTPPGWRAIGTPSARAALHGARLSLVAPARTISLKADVLSELSAHAQRLGTSRADLVTRAVKQYIPTIQTIAEQPHLGSFAALPPDYHRSAARIYRALMDLGGGPVTSQKIADYVQLHRGNVDRHLTRLRSDGYVERTAHGHRIVTTTERAEEQTGPAVG